jgi:hypothetical protein
MKIKMTGSIKVVIRIEPDIYLGIIKVRYLVEQFPQRARALSYADHIDGQFRNPPESSRLSVNGCPRVCRKNPGAGMSERAIGDRFACYLNRFGQSYSASQQGRQASSKLGNRHLTHCFRRQPAA